ncbi:hypothetical protein BDR03DRAFT_1042754, partial [Suillus americanus]
DCSDRQQARRQAAEAQNHIFESLGECYGLCIIPGSNSFLVLPKNISRSTAAGVILHPGGPAHSPRSSSVPDPDVPVNGGVEAGFVFAVGGDEKLLRRLNELDNAEMVSTSGKGTDAKWKLDAGDVGDVMQLFGNCQYLFSNSYHVGYSSSHIQRGWERCRARAAKLDREALGQAAGVRVQCLHSNATYLTFCIDGAVQQDPPAQWQTLVMRYLSKRDETPERQDVERQAQAFWGSVLRSILPVIAKAELRVIIGLLVLLLGRTNVVVSAQTRVQAFCLIMHRVTHSLHSSWNRHVNIVLESNQDS